MNQDNPKLVFAGPVGAGKSTAIRSISDSAPVSTDVPMSEGVSGDKTTTTVALDFSTVMLDENTPLLVYGLPGQDHFSFMRSIVLQGAIGVILLLSASDDDVADQCETWLKSIREINADIAIAIGITHTDTARGFNMANVRAAIRRCGTPLPVFTLDTRDRAQTMHLVRAMLISR